MTCNVFIQEMRVDLRFQSFQPRGFFIQLRNIILLDQFVYVFRHQIELAGKVVYFCVAPLSTLVLKLPSPTLFICLAST